MYPIIASFRFIDVISFILLLTISFFIFLILDKDLRNKKKNPIYAVIFLILMIPISILLIKFVGFKSNSTFKVDISSYGISLGIGFYLGFLLLERELKIREKDPELAYKLLLAAIPCGIIGSKIAHILEHLDEFAADPFGMTFSGAGLSVYGGFLLSMLVIGIILKHQKESFLEIGDIGVPTLALGYCFGRFGCHASGDGCYGVETSSFWGTAYPNGIVPISTPVYPTPLFEVFFSFLVLGLMLQLRKKELPRGFLFFLYLILFSIPRFLVEFIRRNPKLIFNLSQAQVISIGLMIAGIAGLIYVINREKKSKLQSSPAA